MDFNPGFVFIAVAALTGCGGGNSGADALAPPPAPAINHAPTIADIADSRNSAYGYETRIQPVIADIDGDSLTVSVAVDDPSAVSATVDTATGEIVLEPLQASRSQVHVDVSDGDLSSSASFWFEVREVTKTVQAMPAAGEAITLLNTSDQPVDFVLTHNGFRTFESVSEMVAHVQSMPAEFAGEPFEHRLWRFVRDNVYHWPYLNPKTWLMDPVVLVNSLGWGPCTSVAATYVELARAAGYEARLWAIGGHVVPEIKINDEWEMFDADLAVYYKRQDRSIAGVQALAADPALILAPIDPILSVDAVPYSPLIADIYSSETDNAIWSSLLPTPDGPTGRVTLPGDAKLTYEGRWTEPPVAYDDDAIIPYEVSLYEQAGMTLAAGWTGKVALPWVVWDVIGNGQVRIDGTTYAVGSDELRQRLRGTDSALPEFDIVQSADAITIVFLVNALRYQIDSTNMVELTGQNVWRVQVGTELLPAEYRAGGPFPSERRKPIQ